MKKLDNFFKTLNQKEPIFEYFSPKNQYIGLISIPHSGLVVPKEIKKFLCSDQIDLQQDVDFFVHELIDIPTLQANGIAILKSNIIRTAVDLNRAKQSAVLNWKKNSQGKQVVIAEIDAETENIISERYYTPYYEMLRALIDELKNHMSFASIIDLHSMPSKATEYHLKINPNQAHTRPDFCVSDRSGISCQKEYIDSICHKLNEHYNHVTQNDPYFGGYITEYIQQEYPDVNNIQIEINRSLYMYEDTFKLAPAHEQLKEKLTKVILETFKDCYHKNKLNS